MGNRTADRLRRVVSFARDMSGTLNLASVLETVGRAATSLTGAEQTRIWLLDDDGGLLISCFDSALTGPADGSPWSVPLGIGAAGRATMTGRVSYSALGDDESTFDGTCCYAVPLIASGRPIGALEVAITDPTVPVEAEVIDVLEAMTCHAATAIEAARLHLQSERLSMSDPLTGLANRRRLDLDLRLEVERAGRYKRPLAFLMIDVDHFKQVNDDRGHAEGDRVLQQLSAVITQHLRSVDTVYRYGGEELAILARETDLAGAARLGSRLREAVERHFLHTGPPVTISIGVATMPAETTDPLELMLAADSALYRAKRAGRNRVMLVTDKESTHSTADPGPLPTQSTDEPTTPQAAL